MTTSNEWLLLEEIDSLFRATVRKFVKERDKVTVEGIALPGLLILSKILRDGEQKLSMLAEQLDFTSGAITALCDKLEAKGFAVRRRLPEDRRSVLLDITQEGKAMMERNRNIGIRCITLLFEGFSAEELEEQKHLYQRLIQQLEHFSSTLLSLAEDNAKKQEEAKPTSQSELHEHRNFLSY
ncbi:DNA-binding MarR family transcriptional regulator [Paenibacillus shirakamiensis]|uniref:DNA-binding MarR family transcriptional regulator n=2 Tax=Paenibacillus shirakamiensis TaxID=1265935 RepID=A0ABS4JD67_9BACL|nr:DNA-binding MarR family transcriptional regulator [Paenibacillus shirakamiensis]